MHVSTPYVHTPCARVLRLSSLYRKATNYKILTEPGKIIEGVPVRALVLGDSAYPLLPFLIGPYPQSATITSLQGEFYMAGLISTP